ncbi:MAG: hypothetical protein WCI11_16975 [Candidatus Methylumidiphilus sp.]
MQAMEFETQLKDGVIQLPLSYQHWQEGQQVKVIVLADENPVSLDAPTNKNINRHAGKITLSQDPLAFQEGIRDEWS